MKTSYASAIVFALSALASGYAAAGDHGGRGYQLSESDASASFVSTKTRAEVLAELAEAQRTGDIVANVGNSNSGKKLNELYPERYPAKPAVQGKTRAQVLAELAEAQHNGELVANLGGGHSGH